MVALLLSDDAAPDGDGRGDSRPVTAATAPRGMVAIRRTTRASGGSTTMPTAYPEDNGMRDAWAACEAGDSRVRAARAATSAATTPRTRRGPDGGGCSRSPSAPGTTDTRTSPIPRTTASMNLPADITEDGFRQLLEDCFDPEKPMAIYRRQGDGRSTRFRPDGASMRDFMESHPEFGGPTDPVARRARMRRRTMLAVGMPMRGPAHRRRGDGRASGSRRRPAARPTSTADARDGGRRANHPDVESACWPAISATGTRRPAGAERHGHLAAGLRRGRRRRPDAVRGRRPPGDRRRPARGRSGETCSRA